MTNSPQIDRSRIEQNVRQAMALMGSMANAYKMAYLGLKGLSASISDAEMSVLEAALIREKVSVEKLAAVCEGDSEDVLKAFCKGAQLQNKSFELYAAELAYESTYAALDIFEAGVMLGAPPQVSSLDLNSLIAEVTQAFTAAEGVDGQPAFEPEEAKKITDALADQFRAMAGSTEQIEEFLEMSKEELPESISDNEDSPVIDADFEQDA